MKKITKLTLTIVCYAIFTISSFGQSDYQGKYVACGGNHTVVLKCDGTVRSFGLNTNGQLGDNTTTNRNTAVQVKGPGGVGFLTDVIAVAAGSDHSLALKSDGTVWAWGKNDFAQLGDNSVTNRLTPVQVVGPGGTGFLTGIVAIDAGGFHSIAVKSDGTVWCWGDDSQGQCGDGPSSLGVNYPIQVKLTSTTYLTDVVSVAAGYQHSIALKSDGTVWTWGLNDKGQLTIGAWTQKFYATQAVDIGGSGVLSNIIAIAGGDYHSVFLKNNGAVLASGWNVDGQLGTGSNSPTNNNAPLATLITTGIGISAGGNNTSAILADSTIKTWGNDVSFQLGNGAANDGSYSATPVSVSNIPTDVVAIGTGGFHSVCLLKTGYARSWGENGSGQLGDGTFTDRNAAVAVSSLQLFFLANAGPDKSYCNGDSVQIGEPATAGITYSWTPTTGLSNPNISNPYVNLTSSSTVTINYILTTSISGLCISQDVVAVTVRAGAVAEFTSDAPVCSDQAVNFINTGSTGTGISYTWSFGTGSTPSTSTVENPSGIIYSSDGLKLVTLSVYDSVCGGFDSKSHGVLIYEQPVSNFTSNAPQCTNTSIDFTNNGSTGSNWSFFWDFGTNAIPANSTSENPTGVLYSTSGTKTITLTVFNQYCTQTSTQTITINSTPTVSFTSTAPKCTGLTVDFTNTGTTTGVTYSWDFGSGATPATSTTQDPTGIIYSTSGIKTITLTSTNSTTGCAVTAINTINIYQTPTVSFSSNASVCENTPVNFTNNSTTGIGISYNWDFGVGATPVSSTSQNPGNILYSSSGNKTVTLTVTNEFQCSAVDTIIIDILSTPTASFTSTAPKCTGLTVDFTNTGTTSGVTYSWDFGSGATPATSIVQNPTGITYSTSGIKTITLTSTNSTSGCAITATNTINIYQTPTVSFSSNAPQCADVSVNFTNTGSSGSNWSYSWNFGQDAIPATSTSENTSGVLYSTGGTKQVTFTISDQSCSNTTSQIININPTPVANFTSMSSNCTGDSVDFQNTGTIGAIYVWDFGSGATPAISTINSPQNIVYSISGIKTVTLITTIGSCTDTSKQTINIVQTPAPFFTTNAPQCEGSAVNFTYTGTVDTNWVYVWDFGVGSTPSSSSQINPQGINYTGSGSKYVLLTVSNGLCSEVASETFTINQTPVANFTSMSSNCTGDSVDFLNIGTPQGNPQTYTITVQDFQFTPDSVNAVVGDTIKWIWVNGSHTTTSDSIPLGATSWDTIIDTLSQSFQYVVTQVGKYYFISTSDSLMGMSGVINVSAPNVTYSWNFDNGATSATNSPQNIVYSTSGIKTVTLITTLGSCTDTSVQTINIAQTPAPSFTTNAPQCEGADINFTYTGTTDTNWTYIWDFGIGANPAQSSQQNVNGVTYTGGGNKTVLLTVKNGLCSEVSQQIITINQLPFANAGKDTTICANRSVQIGTNPVSNYGYNWFPSNTLNNTSIANPVSSPIANITNYVVTVRDTLTGCINTDSVVVTMLAPLNANAGVDVEICRHESIQVGAALLEGQLYSWSPIAGLSSITSPNPIATPDSTTTYTLTVTGFGCEPETDEVTVIVHQLPITDAGLSDSITHGSSIQLTATGGVQYDWSPALGLSNTGIYNPVAFPDVTTTYTVIGIDIYGCKNDDSVTIYVISPSVWVPSAFTPDGNGKNDVFYVRGEGINNFEFAIYNSWGESVFYTKSISNGWDGRKMTTNEQLPEGAYVYYVKGLLTNGEAVNLKGIVNLIR
ncbi:MAG: hypothetical protein A2X08_14395 [Bacteroidetes bacterium GWA2_32_17]|nr:MAG: hypothetical protein A2X08_14395 [Bacteroidetes bacterium GWA2_32_17]